VKPCPLPSSRPFALYCNPFPLDRSSKSGYHRRTSSVNFRGHDVHFGPKKYARKINKTPEFYMILARKISKIPEILQYFFPKNLQRFRILHDFARKMPEFYIIIARKIFSPILAEGTCPLCPPSTPMPVIEVWSVLHGSGVQGRP